MQTDAPKCTIIILPSLELSLSGDIGKTSDSGIIDAMMEASTLKGFSGNDLPLACSLIRRIYCFAISKL
jgi:hypothetical protein